MDTKPPLFESASNITAQLTIETRVMSRMSCLLCYATTMYCTTRLVVGWIRNMSCDQWLVLGKRFVTKCYEWLWVVVVLKIQS